MMTEEQLNRRQLRAKRRKEKAQEKTEKDKVCTLVLRFVNYHMTYVVKKHFKFSKFNTIFKQDFRMMCTRLISVAECCIRQL